MPEGHTIHRIARDQNALLAGKRLHISSPQGRFTDPARLIDKKKLKTIEAAGKHLFYHFEGKFILHVHLGLFGKYKVHPGPAPQPRGAVRVRFQTANTTIDLNGPNQCELIDRAHYQAILDRLGPDPLRDDADPRRAWTRIHASRQPIGLLLMDQSVIAGIGNIYRTEILHLLKIHPRLPGRALTRPQFNKLWKLAKTLLTVGVEHNRIITIDLKRFKGSIEKTARTKLFRVFKKPTCPHCKGVVERYTMAGRKVFVCPACQVAPTP